MYHVLEIKKKTDGTVTATNSSSHATREEALSKFYANLSANAQGSEAVDSVIMHDDRGMEWKVERIVHDEDATKVPAENRTYFVREVIGNHDGSGEAGKSSKYVGIDGAIAKFYGLCSTAVVSDKDYDSVYMIDEFGGLTKREVFVHYVEPTPEPETITE